MNHVTNFGCDDIPLIMAFVEGLMADVESINNRLKQLQKYRFICDSEIKSLIESLDNSKSRGQQFLSDHCKN